MSNLAKSSTPSRYKVLLIESERSTRELLVRFLNKGGITDVIEATNAEQAWNDIAQNGPRGINVIVTEVALPGMSGTAFIKKLRGLANKWAKTVPIVILSSDSDTSTYSAVRPFNIAAYLVKPVSAELLKTTIERAADGMGRVWDSALASVVPATQSSPKAAPSNSLFLSVIQMLTTPRPPAAVVRPPVALNVMA